METAFIGITFTWLNVWSICTHSNQTKMIGLAKLFFTAIRKSLKSLNHNNFEQLLNPRLGCKCAIKSVEVMFFVLSLVGSLEPMWHYCRQDLSDSISSSDRLWYFNDSRGAVVGANQTGTGPDSGKQLRKHCRYPRGIHCTLLWTAGWDSRGGGNNDAAPAGNGEEAQWT